MQLFPHEVVDVHPVLDLLSRQNPKDPEVSLDQFYLTMAKLTIIKAVTPLKNECVTVL